MRKFTKILAYMAFAFGVAMSWAETPDQPPSAQDRLTQAIDNASQSATPRDLENSPKPESKDSVPNNPVSKKPAGLLNRATEYLTRTILPGFSEIPKNIRGDGGDSEGDSSGLWDWMKDGNKSNQNTAGNNAGAGNKLVTNDNAEAQDPNAAGDDGKPRQIAPPSTPAGGGGASVQGNGQKLNLWWPVCAFVDENVSDAKANAALKGMVDKAAQTCGVLIEVFAVKVQHSSWGSWALEPDKINEQTVDKCNLPGGLAGSATALVHPSWKYTAAVMCDDFTPKKDGPHTKGGQEGEWNAGVAGCAQLRSGTQLGDDFKKHQDQQPSGSAHGKHGSTTASGGVAPSIEVDSGQSAEVVSHEAIGHSMMGKPNGVVHGLGIGDEDDLLPKPQGKGLKEGGSPSGTWTQQGCGVMRSNAHPISKWTSVFGGAPPLYDSSRETYYRPGPLGYDIVGGPKLFEPRKTVPPPGPMLVQQPPPTGGGVRSAQTPAGSGKTIDPAEDVFASNKIGNPEPDESVPEKHKKGPKIPDASVASIRASEQAAAANANPLPGDVNDTVNVGFEAPASGRTYSKGSKIKFADSPSSGPRSSGSGKYDESVYADMFSGKNAGGSSRSSSSTRGAITYNDNAEVNPLAGTMDSGPSTSGAGGFGPMNGSVGSAMGDGFDFNGAGAATGGATTKPGFDNKVFNVGRDSSVEEEEGEGADRLRRKGDSRKRDGGIRRPASDDNSGLVRVNRPGYREGDK